MSKRVILWSPPRTLSSAFYRSISTLSKTKSFYELYSYPYYFGPPTDRQCSYRYEPDFVPSDGLVCEPTYAAVKAVLLQDYPGVDLVFTKELSFCLPESMRQEIIDAGFVHTFLIRDPERAVYSYYKLFETEVVPGYDSLNTEEIILSYRELLKIYDLVKDHLGRVPVVVNASDLQAYPDETMRSYCEAVGIQYEPHMTTWKPGPVPGPEIWNVYHRSLMQSSGFVRMSPEEQKPVPLDKLPQEVVDCIDKCRPSYEAMLGACIKPYSGSS